MWVKRHHTKALEPKWKGPYVVILTTPTALKVDGIRPWVHCNHVRQATPEEQERAQKEWEVTPRPSNPFKMKLTRRRDPDKLSWSCRRRPDFDPHVFPGAVSRHESAPCLRSSRPLGIVSTWEAVVSFLQILDIQGEVSHTEFQMGSD